MTSSDIQICKGMMGLKNTEEKKTNQQYPPLPNKEAQIRPREDGHCVVVVENSVGKIYLLTLV